MSTAARDEVLRRVRRAIAGTSPVEIPRGYRRAGSGGPAPVARFVERVDDYRAGVRRVAAAEVADGVAAALADGLARREAPAGRRPVVVAPDGVAQSWLTAIDGDLRADVGLDAAALDDVDAVITGAAVAIAETGTIVLDASPDQGRRALTLVPDVHVCVVEASRIVAGVPDAVAQLDPARPLTWISGPSATSDIELDRVEGVHGPRILEVVVLDTP